MSVWVSGMEMSTAEGESPVQPIQDISHEVAHMSRVDWDFCAKSVVNLIEG